MIPQTGFYLVDEGRSGSPDHHWPGRAGSMRCALDFSLLRKKKGLGPIAKGLEISG
jgi:hypothetical protein